MRNFIYIILIIFATIFSGCSNKTMFEPKEISGEVSYDGTLPSSIIDKSLQSAVLEDGEFITKNEGLIKEKLPKDFIVLNEDDNGFIIADKAGNLKILSKDGKAQYEKSFEDIVASATLNGDLLSIVFANNRLMLYSIKTDEVFFNEKLEPVYALDSRIANPAFLNDLVIFPTLDGRLLIIDITHKKILRDLVISNEKYFNNVIFLKVIGNRLIAATNTKVMSINPKGINIYGDSEIKDILFLEDRVYIFTKDGKVVLTDTDLKVLKEKKFPFAIFSGVIYGEFIYLIEKGGYIIAVDKDLITANYYKLPNEIDDLLFTAKDTLYYDNNYFKLNTKK